MSHSPGNTLTCVLIVLMSQIAYKETRTSYIRQNYDTLAYSNYITDYPERQ